MKNLTNAITITLITIVINLFVSNLKAEVVSENELDSLPKNRKKIHIYFTPIAISGYTEYPFRKRQENSTFSFLYGITEKFYLGLTYSRGDSPNFRTQLNFSTSQNGIGLQDTSKTRESEFLVIRSQYFFYGNFYGSANFGFEKGFKQEDKNYRSINGYNTSLEPYSKTTIYSDRFFTTIGLGYRKEIFDRILVGFECEYGIMNSGRSSQHYTFNPQFYNGFPSNYLIDLFIIRNQNKQYSEFHYISVYAGIAI
ncbi:hypothetical protein [Leptospira levettii]|uniref:hypothetical protein n=1 Tax=Leptospira levettii TaxID=2023178 RepID=UPI00223D7CA3|nr:hypothetical protein [Leptospira levettii]MCW7475636.1 hypothetical protein [Leptospira levettii]